MPRFMLSIHTGESLLTDLEGSDVTEFDEALHEAVASARELWAEGIRKGEDRSHWAIVITRTAGDTVQVLPFMDAVQRKRERARQNQ
jgi:hypothetical protein